jgi:hypothetical protein
MAGDAEYWVRDKTYTGSGAGNVILTPNPMRIGVWVTPAGGGVITGSISIVMPSGSRITFSAGSNLNFQVLYRDWGPIPGYQFIEATGGISGSLTVVELLLTQRQ